MTVFEEADDLMTTKGWTFIMSTRRSGWGADARKPGQGSAGDSTGARTEHIDDWRGGWVFGRTLEIALTKAIKRANGIKLGSFYADSDE